MVDLSSNLLGLKNITTWRSCLISIVSNADTKANIVASEKNDVHVTTEISIADFGSSTP